ncbi:DMT family transporter [Thioclava sp. GXIMD4216]|uniref:DMT family transporter n=1 Tax=Thioclava litoralis TaxID=3076557 RepID=A0ABZ1E1I5_9RHOB|nr:DMT family transporter [Thioclava sp. FTW29]
MNSILYALMALAGGIGLSCQAAINSRLSAGIGGQPLVASFISFFIGALCLGAAALVLADWNAVTTTLAQQPWWRWLGGVIGAGFVFTSIFLAPKIGVTNVMFLFIIGQLAAGMVIDSFGLIQMPVRPTEWWKFAGLAIMLGGLTLFMFGGRFFPSE